MLELVLFGGMQILRDGAPVSGFDSVKTRALLAYLAVEADRAHSRHELAALLWSEKPDADARRSLRQALNNLQRTIQNQNAQPPFVHITLQEIQFNRASEARADVWDFVRLANGELRIAQTDEVTLRDLQNAIGLYRGDLLPHLFIDDSPAFEEWLLLAREKYHQLALDAASRLLRHFRAQGDAGRGEVVRYAQRLLELEAWHEPAHRALMEEYARAGNRNAALAQYETLRRVLVEELGVEPSAETTALYVHLKRGQFSSATETQPPRTLNLPAALSPFIGRVRELEKIVARFQDGMCRWLTLLGPGGIGKTRLATRFVAQYAGRTGANVCFVACETLNHADELPSALANALQLQTRGETDALDFLRAQEREWLLVLDNLEQLTDAGQAIDEILAHAPHARVLATSRERLHGAGEWALEVEGLGVPHDETRLQDSEAATLLLSVARRAGHVEVLDAREQRAVVRICELVDGMPLALELAGANARALTFEEIANEIARDLDFLTNASPHAPARHASLRVVMEQSWRRLDARAQMVMTRLRIFRGGLTREAAMQVVPTAGQVLIHLVDKSLLRRTPNGRYTLHPLVAQFIAAQPLSASDENALAERHARYFLEWLVAHAPALNDENAQRVLQAFRFDLENIRAAWQLALEHEMFGADARVVRALSEFHQHTGLYQAGIGLLEMARGKIQEDAWRAELAGARSDILMRMGNYGDALAAAEQTLAVGIALDRADLQAWGELGCGRALTRQGKYDAAQVHLERARVLAEQADWVVGTAQIDLWLGAILEERGDTEGKLQANLRALEVSRRLSNRRLEAQVMSDLGGAYVIRQDFEHGQFYLERALELRRLVGDPFGEMRTLALLSVLSWRQAQFQVSISFNELSATLAQQVGDRSGYCVAQINLSELWLEVGAFERARMLAQRGFVLAEELSLRWGELVGLLNQAAAHYQLRDWLKGERLAREALALAEKNSARQEQSEAWRLLTDLYAAQEKWNAAAEAARQAAAAANQFDDPAYGIHANFKIASVAWQRGELDTARSSIESILEPLEHATPLRWQDWVTGLWVTFQILDASGDARAGALLERAQTLVRHIASQMTDEPIREMYLNVPTIRAVLGAAK